MPKLIKPMSAKAVDSLTKVGWHAVGGVSGLNLQIRKPNGSGSITPRSWILRTHIGGERVPLGLGSYPQVSLAKARDLAREMSNDIQRGIDPRVRRKQIKSDLMASIAKNKTFKDCAEAYMDAKESSHTNDKHKKQWRATLNTYAYPIIGSMLVGDISMRNVLDVLLQEIQDSKTKKIIGKFWEVKTETASRVQQRMKAVFDFAMVNEYRTNNNPALWEGFLDTQLASPKKIKTVIHHPSLHYQELGNFIFNLRRNDSISAKALEFLIYSGFRSGSVRLARWEDIDFDNAVWNIPAIDTKMKVEHTVPLSKAAVRFLQDLNERQERDGISSQYLFPSPTNKTLSDMALSELMRGMKERDEFASEAVPHGFRSTFRTWMAEQTNYPDEIRKAANGHKVSDAVKASYERTTFFEKRRKLMEEWSAFLDKPSIKKSGDVIPMKKKA